MKQEGKESPVAQVYVYGHIGKGQEGTTAADFMAALSEAQENHAEAVEVYINSPGGDVQEGLSMYHALQHCPLPTRCVVEGIAASIAGVIALGAERTEIVPYGLFMVHDPFSMNAGNARELRQQAEKLEKVGLSLAGIYARKCGRSTEEVLDLMAGETWLNAEESVHYGFCDAVYQLGQAQGESRAEAIYNSLRSDGDRNGLKAIRGEDKEAGQHADVQAQLDTWKKRTIALQLEQALAEGRIVQAQWADWEALFEQDYERAQRLIQHGTQQREGIYDRLRAGSGSESQRNWTIREWEKEDPEGLLELRRRDPATYHQLFEEYYEA